MNTTPHVPTPHHTRQHQADLLEKQPLAEISEEDFYFPKHIAGEGHLEGEPSNADELWDREHGSDELREFWSLQGKLWMLLGFNVGLIPFAFIVRAVGMGQPQSAGLYKGTMLLIGLWWWASAVWAFWARSRIYINIFDFRVWHAFEQAKSSPQPWQMNRWLGRAFHLVRRSPCLIKKLDIWQADDGIRTPNSFDYILNRLREAGVFALRSFAAQDSAEGLVAKYRYDRLLESLMGDTQNSPLTKLKHRWTITAHRLAWAIAFIAIVYGTSAIVIVIF